MTRQSKLKLGGKKLALVGLALAIVVGLLAYLGAGAGPIGRVLPLAARGGETEGQPRSEKASPSPATCRQLALEPLVVNLAEPGSRRYLR
ncbi:MAG: hypothetical protein H5U01_02145, partial [Clostridia bacterium]|nr:hypothetical protein [Clostridia bacterium]